MKKSILIILSLILIIILCSCDKGEQGNMQTTNANIGNVTFINEISEADIWILPQTEENLKTTVWGTATAALVKTGESRKIPLCEPSDDGLYIFRMFDTDGYYYSANGLTIEAGWTVKIKGEDLHSITIEVTDENGTLQKTYEVFVARL